jgi:ribosomal-protein-alanine N-acetyltransferase
MQPSEAMYVDAIARETGFALDSEQELKLAMARLWVARIDESSVEPDAFLVVWVAADELHIIAIGTRHERQRMGLGRELVKTLFACARAEQKRLILLEVRRSNRAAAALYRSFGFSVSRLRRGYYSAPVEDGVEMMVILNAQGQVEQMPDEVSGLEV